jgi:hypothetical protein
MIPVLLFAGFVLGAFVHDRRSAQFGVISAVAVSGAWGTLIGVADGEFSTVVGASLLGLANIAFGAVLAVAVRRLAQLTRR